MDLLSFLAIEFKWYHWVVLSALAIVIILAVVFFRVNTKTQMKVSFNMDDETNVYNLKGLDIYISKNQKKYTNPTLAVVEIKNLAIIYKAHSKKRELMIRIADLLLKGMRQEETLARIEFNKFAIIYNDRSKEEIRFVHKKPQRDRRPHCSREPQEQEEELRNPGEGWTYRTIRKRNRDPR